MSVQIFFLPNHPFFKVFKTHPRWFLNLNEKFMNLVQNGNGHGPGRGEALSVWHDTSLSHSGRQRALSSRQPLEPELRREARRVVQRATAAVRADDGGAAPQDLDTRGSVRRPGQLARRSGTSRTGPSSPGETRTRL